MEKFSSSRFGVFLTNGRPSSLCTGRRRFSEGSEVFYVRH